MKQGDDAIPAQQVVEAFEKTSDNLTLSGVYSVDSNVEAYLRPTTMPPGTTPQLAQNQANTVTRELPERNSSEETTMDSNSTTTAASSDVAGTVVGTLFAFIFFVGFCLCGVFTYLKVFGKQPNWMETRLKNALNKKGGKGSGESAGGGSSPDKKSDKPMSKEERRLLRVGEHVAC